MSIKKRKPLSSAIKEFVFGTKEKEAAPPPTPDVISPASTPTASLKPEAALPASTGPTPRTAETALPIAKPPQPEVSARESVSIQSKEPSLMSKLQIPDKEATVKFTVDMFESLRRKLSMLAAKIGRKKMNQSADAAGGWIERGCVGVRILSIKIAIAVLGAW